MTTTNLATIDPATRAILDRYGFDAARFESLAARVASGDLSPASNAVHGSVEPPAPGTVQRVPQPGSDAFAEAHAAGVAAIRRGEVAMAVLNGGMATRFGGVVKGVVEALDGSSFIEWKLGEVLRVARAVGGEIPCVMMNSFATDADTTAYLAALRERDPFLPEPLTFTQSVLLRLNPDGTLFIADDGSPSLYGPGHGDFQECLRESGTLASLRARGVRHVMLSNVDNLGARIDPVVIGAHLLAGQPMTVEVAAKNPGDVGGAPARVDGRTMILEDFRFPPDFNHASIPVFNCNSFVLDTEALDATYPLTWFYVSKSVEGRTAIQLERLVGELSSFIPATYLEIDRDGTRGRFFPVKTPADLAAIRPALREMLAAELV